MVVVLLQLDLMLKIGLIPHKAMQVPLTQG